MKKKGHPQIPDFSTKRAVPRGSEPTPASQKVKGFHAAPIPGGKPHSTSKKSGRRGA
jgi:hypothetical protein